MDARPLPADAAGHPVEEMACPVPRKRAGGWRCALDRREIEITERSPPEGHREGAIVPIVVRCECGNVIQTRDENAGRRALSGLSCAR